VKVVAEEKNEFRPEFRPVVDATVELAEPDACLQPLVSGNVVIGFVDHVNGPGAGLVRGFVPTRQEVLEIAKYWAGLSIRNDYSMWCYQFWGSQPSREVAFAGLRLAKISECLGEAEVDNVVEEVRDDFGSTKNPKIWAAYTTGADIPRDEEGCPLIPDEPVTD
jgi:hypothetical protein